MLIVVHVQGASAAALWGTMQMSGISYNVFARARKLENAAMHCHLSGQGGRDDTAELRDKASQST